MLQTRSVLVFGGRTVVIDLLWSASATSILRMHRLLVAVEVVDSVEGGIADGAGVGDILVDLLMPMKRAECLQ